MREIIDSSSLSPINVTWELTLACNLMCKHCGSAAGKCRSNELSLERALKLCTELKKLGTKEVTLIGGEPLISDKWFSVAKKLNELEIKVNFVSNGTIMNKKIVKQLTGAKQVRVRDMNGIAKIEVGVDELSLLENNLVLQKVKSQLKLISFEDVSIDPEGYRPGKINVITN